MRWIRIDMLPQSVAEYIIAISQSSFAAIRRGAREELTSRIAGPYFHVGRCITLFESISTASLFVPITLSMAGLANIALLGASLVLEAVFVAVGFRYLRRRTRIVMGFAVCGANRTDELARRLVDRQLTSATSIRVDNVASCLPTPVSLVLDEYLFLSCAGVLYCYGLAIGDRMSSTIGIPAAIVGVALAGFTIMIALSNGQRLSAIRRKVTSPSTELLP